MTDKLTDKQGAEKYRQIADLMDETGNTLTAAAWRELADHLDPPTDPYAGLNRDQWVEIEDGHGTRRVTHVRAARESHPDWSLTRVIPEGDARDVLVIPYGEALEASQDSGGACKCLIDAALIEARERGQVEGGYEAARYVEALRAAEAERDELRATVERVEDLAERYCNIGPEDLRDALRGESDE